MKIKFNKVSTNDGYSISKENALKCLRAVGLNPSKKEFSNAMKETHFGDDDKITFDEFQDLAKLMWYEESPEEILNECFRHFDKDNNGVISSAEFKELMMNRGEMLNEAELQDLLQLADQNHDGKINYSGK